MTTIQVGYAWPSTMWFRCPDCGPRIAVDEDGCCTMCGADAVAEAATPPPVIVIPDQEPPMAEKAMDHAARFAGN